MVLNKVHNEDCLSGMKKLKEFGIKVDLILTDPPYLLKNLRAGGHSRLAASIQKVNSELGRNELNTGIGREYLELMWSLMKIPNIYIWCNGAQLDFYMDFFLREKGCKMDIIIWYKTNAPPLFYGKYLCDKEYCLYFRKGGCCNPQSYQEAKTVYVSSANVKDKRKYRHPTIKPFEIIHTLLKNSSRPGDLILDPFSGSGTTLVAAKVLNRNYIGYEINPEYYEASLKRLASVDCEGEEN